jgi:hypothetical protein
MLARGIEGHCAMTIARAPLRAGYRFIRSILKSRPLGSTLEMSFSPGRR